MSSEYGVAGEEEAHIVEGKHVPSMKNKCAPAYRGCPPEKSRMILSTFWEVAMTRYMASNPGEGSRLLVIDSISTKGGDGGESGREGAQRRE